MNEKKRRDQLQMLDDGRAPRGSRLNPLTVECVLLHAASTWRKPDDMALAVTYKFTATGTLSTSRKKRPKAFRVDMWSGKPQLPDHIANDMSRGRVLQESLLETLRAAFAEAAGTVRTEGLTMDKLVENE